MYKDNNVAFHDLWESYCDEEDPACYDEEALIAFMLKQSREEYNTAWNSYCNN